LSEPHFQTGDPFDLRVSILKDGQWLRVKNDIISHEPLEVGKLRPIAIIYDNSPSMAWLPVIPSSSLEGLAKRQLAIDAEYVFYEKAQIEFHSDGSQHLVKPSKTRLARLSVVDVASDKVVIDEHVALEPDEHIADYCSHISGICESDLIPGISTRTLISRKVCKHSLFHYSRHLAFAAETASADRL